ncbi:MAG: hypothetical protein ACE37K_20220 [Planctomycetota bacterium]
MKDDDFRARLQEWLPSNHTKLLGELPAHSGLYRIVDVAADTYRTGYVSTNPGSYKTGAESGNWYGTDFLVAEAEVRPTVLPVFEVSCLLQGTPVLDMHGLPQDLADALYEDRDLPSGSYTKSQIVREEVSELVSPDSYSGIYFPSRRCEGGVILYNPAQVPSKVIYTGKEPPPPDEINWNAGTP